MYNTDYPTRAELPTFAQLRRSTFIAATSAAVILVTIVFPSEYGVDVTGVGRLLQLTEMGEIKTQLAKEAEADRVTTAAISQSKPVVTEEQVNAIALRLALLERAVYEKNPSTQQTVVEENLDAITIPSREVSAQQVTVPPVAAESADSGVKRDEMSVILQPGEGTEIKMVMKDGAAANYWWSANGGLLNFDAHGDGGGQSVSYEKGRWIGQGEGVMTAAFTGNHGWFWRNRSNNSVTLTVRTSGEYAELKRMK